MSERSPAAASRWVGVARAVMSRPDLWVTALRQVARLAPARWWRRWPPLPLPDRAYLRFRMETAYGDPEAEPAPADVVTYLAWCRRQDRRRGAG